MKLLRWLLVPLALAVCLPLLGLVIAVYALYPPHVTITATVLLGLGGFWFYFARRRTAGDSSMVDGEASLLPSSKAKAGLL